MTAVSAGHDLDMNDLDMPDLDLTLDLDMLALDLFVSKCWGCRCLLAAAQNMEKACLLVSQEVRLDGWMLAW